MPSAEEPAQNQDSVPGRQSHRIGQIGEDGKTLRVLNFSGGGFDSIMQLGVTHALLVSQGKAPDVVVGVSAGAIQAVALADVMHSGEMPDDLGTLDANDYRNVLDARVIKFRRFVDASHQAPEMILDSIVPDAYQVDSFEPLASLQLPRLSEDERKDRDKWIVKKSGMVRLYNDLLSLDLPFGTITRLIRRILGISAAGALSSRTKRITVRVIETMRVWLLIGARLRRLTPLLPIVGRPLLGKKSGVHPMSAGSIIFRFPVIEKILNRARLVWSFFLLVNFWVWLSWLFIGSFIWLTLYLNSDETEVHVLIYLFYLIYFVPLILPLTPVAMAFDRSGFLSTLRDLSKGLFAFTLYLVKWSIVVVAMGFGFAYLLSALPVAALLIAWSPSDATNTFLVIALMLFGFAVLITIFRPVYVLFRTTLSFWWTGKRKNVGLLRWYMRRFLDYYGLGSSLADNYGLKKFLVNNFDPSYYGAVQMSSVINASVTDRDQSIERTRRNPRRISEFSTSVDRNKARIVVAIAAADVGAGKLGVIDADSSIVDGLLAATAMNPVYPPQPLNGRLYIDGINIGNVPTKALVELFTNEGIADVNGVHIYAVDPLPVSKEELGPSSTVGNGPYVNLIDIALRALQLQRYRDATIERKLTKLITNVIHPGTPVAEIEQRGRHRKYFRGFVAPIELDHAADLNRKILVAKKEARRDALAEAISAGCRASLQSMLRETLQQMLKDDKWESERNDGFISCASVIAEAQKRDTAAKFDLQEIMLPGSDGNNPGLSEICRHCALKDKQQRKKKPIAKQCLRFEKDDLPEEIGDWPLELAKVEELPVPAKEQQVQAKQARKSSNSPDEYPIKACLFSGGVFRGVFQMGVLNALGLLGLRPELVAGASVGSITAAMVARALRSDSEASRANKIAELSAVYLGIDRIVLTDRFADFIRNWTIRAAESRFSLRQADEVFRKYDARSARIFQRNVRQVVAGIERLFYINPYQLNELVALTRNRQSAELGRKMKDRIQQWLDRMDVGAEVLGAEAIQLLIEELVVPDEYRNNESATPFNCFGDDFHFLATTTNLTTGKLEVLGRRNDRNKVTLLEGLLASSAFPGVFRPRRSWDLMPGTDENYQYIDGGVMDNLPLDAVLHEMQELAASGQIVRRPETGPHLMLAASLEVTQRDESNVDMYGMENYWPELASRSKELRYNTKLDTFARVSDNIQALCEKQKAVGKTPLNVRVLSIKPRWLCNTFAFHPMLGFRKAMQARSIAHGCAATLLAFGDAREHASAWKLNEDAIPAESSFEDALFSHSRNRSSIRSGKCWLRDVPCPFSSVELEKLENSPLDKSAKKWLSRIHTSCWDAQTHDHR